MQQKLYKSLSAQKTIMMDRGKWRICSAPECLVSNACVPGSKPADPTWVSQRNIIVCILSM